MNLQILILTCWLFLLLPLKALPPLYSMEEWNAFRQGQTSFAVYNTSAPKRIFIVIHGERALSVKWPDRKLGPHSSSIKHSGVYDAENMQFLWPIAEDDAVLSSYHLSHDFSTWAFHTRIPPERNGSSDMPALRLYREGKALATYSFQELLRKPHSREHFHSANQWLKASNYQDDQLQLVTDDRIITLFNQEIPLGGSERIIVDMRIGQIRSRKESLFHTNAYLAGIGFLLLIVYVAIRTVWHFQVKQRTPPDFNQVQKPEAVGSHRA